MIYCKLATSLLNAVKYCTKDLYKKHNALNTLKKWRFSKVNGYYVNKRFFYMLSQLKYQESILQGIGIAD